MALAVSLSLLQSEPAAADNVFWRLQLESGGEFDTNAHRAYGSRVGSPLLRSGARLDFGWKLAPDHRLSANTFAGGKRYLSESVRTEDVVISTSDIRYRWRLPERRLILAAHVNYYDTLAYSHEYTPALDCMSSASVPRFFSNGVGGLSVTASGPGEHRLRVSAGMQRFRYKACSQFDWTGDRYGARYQTTTWLSDPDEDLDAASIDILVDYQLQKRQYRGEVLVNIPCPSDSNTDQPCFFGQTGIDHSALHHAVTGQIIYTGDRIYSARYELAITDSNSFGRSLIRHRLQLGATTELVARVFLTVNVAVQFDGYLDGLYLGPDDTGQPIDDENHNALSLLLARDITQAWSLEARYGLHTSELGDEQRSYRRQVVYVGAVYRYKP